MDSITTVKKGRSNSLAAAQFGLEATVDLAGREVPIVDGARYLLAAAAKGLAKKGLGSDQISYELEPLTASVEKQISPSRWVERFVLAARSRGMDRRQIEQQLSYQMRENARLDHIGYWPEPEAVL